MKRKFYSASLLSVFLTSLSLYSAEMMVDDSAQIASMEFCRKEALPADHCEDMTDSFMQGYIQALIDVHYYEHRVRVFVDEHRVYLAHLPKNDLLSSSIVSFVRDIPGVCEVIVTDELPCPRCEGKERYIERAQVKGVWFPQSTVLFAPFVSAPREVRYSAAFRYGDKVIGRYVASVAMGDEFPIFRWKDVFRWCGDLQVGITGGIWAVFNFEGVTHNDELSELVNTDYYLGIPFSYAFDRWSFRLRIYHISSHLGDEYLVNHPEKVASRKNPSFEAIDFFGSYQVSKNIRLYLGPGVVIHSDDSFKMKTLYVEYGAEFRFMGRNLDYHRLYGTPFIAAHFENWQVRHWGIDATVMIGYEWSKLQGIGRKMRVYIDGHKGFSVEGQFFKRHTQYAEFGLSWGF